MLAQRSFLFSRNSTSSSSPKAGSKRYEDSKSVPVATTRNANHTMPPAPNTSMSRPTTSEPVIIPVRNHRESSRDSQRHNDRKDRRSGGKQQRSSRGQDVHSPDSIPPAVAALLAMTSIPPQKKNSVRRPTQAQRLTVDAVLTHTRVTEKEFSMSFGKSPLDVLLGPPDDLEEEEEATESEIGTESYLSTRTISTESVPSLNASSIGDSSASPGPPATPNSRGRRPARRMKSLSSPPGDSTLDHPLSPTQIDLDELDFRVYDSPTSLDDQEHEPWIQAPWRKSAFKSNLTASLKALRSAAKSFSTMATPMITPDDFLTRSIISIDPQVPFTDERMPPRLEDTPTPALRRYLNPTTNAPIEAHVPASLAQTTSTSKCTTSIQMQTYRVSKSPKSTASPSVISRRTNTTTLEVFAEVNAEPVARQRDMRENSDFIRIAVMEMMMRKNGKLDEKMPGRAKWALPPRQPSTKVYEIGAGGVPVRWIASTL